MEAVGGLVKRVLNVTIDMQNRFWGQPLLREEEIRDWPTATGSAKAHAG
jgi:hypothetical protein